VNEVRIIVDNRVRIEEPTRLPHDVLMRLKALFTHVNPEFMKKRNMGLPMWNVPREIVTWKSGSNCITFPRGGAQKVLDTLTSAGIDATVVDARQYGVEYSAPKHNMQLYPYQRDVVDAILEREQCIVRAPTGSGKSSLLLALAAEVQVPTLVLLHSQGLLNQWKARAMKELGLRDKQVGIIQGKKFNLRPLTLALHKTMLRVANESEEVRNYFGCIIADETQMAAAKTCFECIDPFPARYRVGASADHRRKDRKEFLIHDLFGDVGINIKREDLIKSGHVLDVQIRVVPTDFAAPWYGMPSEQAPELSIDFVTLCKQMAADPERNNQALRMVRDEVLAGEQVLVMAHEREHCMHIGQQLVAMGIPAGYLMGGVESAKEFEANLAALKTGELRVGVGTYAAIGTGIDIPRISVGVAVTPIAANEQFFNQVRGRFCRTAKGKKSARLYVMWDPHVNRTHLGNMIRWNTDVVVRELDGTWEPARHHPDYQ
jgi:superfamily II DNA or RNA helicase